MMRFLFGLLWLGLFLLLFGFALNNTALTDLRFFAGVEWRAPLVALLLVFFVAGVVFGVLAMLPLWFRQRRELKRQRRAPQADQTPLGTPTRPPLQTVAQGARTTN